MCKIINAAREMEGREGMFAAILILFVRLVPTEARRQPLKNSLIWLIERYPELLRFHHFESFQHFRHDNRLSCFWSRTNWTKFEIYCYCSKWIAALTFNDSLQLTQCRLRWRIWKIPVFNRILRFFPDFFKGELLLILIN